jgi:hypothetical protein
MACPPNHHQTAHSPNFLLQQHNSLVLNHYLNPNHQQNGNASLLRKVSRSVYVKRRYGMRNDRSGSTVGARMVKIRRRRNSGFMKSRLMLVRVVVVVVVGMKLD